MRSGWDKRDSHLRYQEEYVLEIFPDDIYGFDARAAVTADRYIACAWREQGSLVLRIA